MLSKIITIILFIILLPIFLIIALLIILEDGFPVFFIQRRVGKNYSFFQIYKFRTMKKNAPNVATHLLGDPDKYLLKVGRFLRKTSLDELPNLVNILKGEMVFIGPRPALYNQEDLLALRIEAGVDKLKPGITGWAQINGRDELNIEEKVAYEKAYLENRSFMLDLKILIITFKKVILSKSISH